MLLYCWGLIAERNLWSCSRKENIFFHRSFEKIGTCGETINKKRKMSWSWQKWKPFLLATSSLRASLKKAWNECSALISCIAGRDSLSQMAESVQQGQVPLSVAATAPWSIPLSHLSLCHTFPSSAAGLVGVREQSGSWSHLSLFWVFGTSFQGFVSLWCTFKMPGRVTETLMHRCAMKV